MLMSSNRRNFLGGGLAAVTASLLPDRARARKRATGDAERHLQSLGIALPEAPNPIATYVTAVISGNMLYVSGHGPADIDGVKSGKVGEALSIDDGRLAARATALNVLATMKSKLGSLDRVVQLVRTFGMVNAAPDFTEHPKVINGYSDVMVQVFGEDAGKGVRAAVGMASLPSNIAVEIESIWEISL
jgi:enamine deaminase RidA (YjgF/YER057c/UK114 family)